MYPKTIHISIAKLYRYKGWFFELPNYGGPWPLKKDGEPRKRAGNKFWVLWEEFSKLDNKEDYRV